MIVGGYNKEGRVRNRKWGKKWRRGKGNERERCRREGSHKSEEEKEGRDGEKK